MRTLVTVEYERRGMEMNALEVLLQRGFASRFRIINRGRKRYLKLMAKTSWKGRHGDAQFLGVNING